MRALEHTLLLAFLIASTTACTDAADDLDVTGTWRGQESASTPQCVSFGLAWSSTLVQDGASISGTGTVSGTGLSTAVFPATFTGTIAGNNVALVVAYSLVERSFEGVLAGDHYLAGTVHDNAVSCTFQLQLAH